MLSHPNVVSVSDQGSDQGLVFLVMELVRGRTLRDLLQARGRLTVGRGVRRPRAGARPGWLPPTGWNRHGGYQAGESTRYDGAAKTLAFIRPRVAGSGQGATPAASSSGSTVAAYLSPEQLERGKADARSDVYAAGHRAVRDATWAPALRRRHPARGRLPARAPRRPHAVGGGPRTGPARSTSSSPAPPAATPSSVPLDAGAFLADLEDVRSDVGVPRVPVPTGRSSAGPGHPAPDQPAAGPQPARSGTPAPRRRHRGARRRSRPRGRGPACCRGWAPARRPTSPVRGPPPPRPAARRPRLPSGAAAPGWPSPSVLLLAVTIGAIGWWLGSGRWTYVLTWSASTCQAAIGQLQEAGLEPDCCEEVFSEDVPTGEVISADPAEGDAIRGTDVHLVVSKGPERFFVDAAWTWLARRGGRPPQLRRRPCRRHAGAGLRRRRPRSGTSTGFDPRARHGRCPATPRCTVFVSRGHAPVAVPAVVGVAADDAAGHARAARLHRRAAPPAAAPTSRPARSWPSPPLPASPPRTRAP